MSKLLEIKNLKTVASDDNNKKILNGLDLEIGIGETHVIMGPNGSGKSTLANTCFNSPKYIVTEGSIIFSAEDITNKSTDYIAKKGLFMSFQTPEEIPGVNVVNFLRTVRSSQTGERVKISDFYKEVNSNLERLNLSKDFASREMNVGFSGGEKKKNEVLQLLMINPKLAILDETDSGLDVDAINLVSNGINLYRNENNSCLIITHNINLLKNINVDKVHILINGKIVKSGDYKLAEKVYKNGFQEYINE